MLRSCSRSGLALLLAAVVTPLAPAAGHSLADLHIDAWGASLDEVRAAITSHADHVEVVPVTPPRHPLASQDETYLVCRDLRTASNDVVATAVYTFADDSLVVVEVETEGLSEGAPSEGDSVVSFPPFVVDVSTFTVTHLEDDHAWILSPEAAHAHAFLWSSPDGSGTHDREGGPDRMDDGSAMALPSCLPLGASIDEVAPLLDAACVATMRRDISEVWLATEPEQQVQIDAYGVTYAGVPRKAEAVFGDGRLELVWILTGRGEEDRLRRMLTAAFGDPVYVDDDIEAFDGWRVALRKDKPEVLFLSERLIPHYRDR